MSVTLRFPFYVEDAECEIHCTYTPGSPGKLYGPPEDCYPPTPAEMEFISATCGGVRFDTPDKFAVWASQQRDEATPTETLLLQIAELAEREYADTCEAAQDDEDDRRAEMRRELSED